MKKNLIKTITIMIAAATLLAGCGNKESDQISELQNKVASLEALIEKNNNSSTSDEDSTKDVSENTSKDNSENTNTSYSKELAQFIFQGDEKAFRYKSDDPLSFMTCTGESEQKNGSAKVYKYELQNNSSANLSDTWSSVIIITGDEMIETNPLSSIAKNKIQLKLPLTEGNTWNQPISYNGKEYTMKHEIIEIVTNPYGKNICVKSTIDNFGSDGSTYIEAATYQQNRGLVASDRLDGGTHGEFIFGLIKTEVERKADGLVLTTYSDCSGIDINKAFE